MTDFVDDLVYSLDPCAFVSARLGLNLDPWQADVMQSSSKRIMLNCSRQSGKSTIASIMALHRALYYPDSLILLVSPSLRQSQELYKKVQYYYKMLEMDAKLPEENRMSMILKNGSRIISLPSSAEKLRGFSSVTLLIEDEAAQVPDELYRTTRPMLAVSNGSHILMSTPYGKRGHFFEEWTGQNDWHRVEIPATRCNRISSEFLEEERISLGEWWYKQEYCCEFGDTIDTLFTYDMIQSAMSDDVKPLFPEFAKGNKEKPKTDERTTSFISDDVQPLFVGGL
jgi:hypothetical protein